MIIAMFGHKHLLSREGGVEIVVKELSTRMAQQGHSVFCYDRLGKHVSGGVVDDKNNYKGVRIIPVWTLDKKGLAAMTSSFSAAKKVAHSSADIVHIHAEGPAAMCGFLKRKKKHVVVTVHGLDWQRAKWGGIASRYIRFGEKQAVKYADAIIVLSKNVQEYFLKQYSRETVLIPNGVNEPEIVESKKIKEQWGLQKDSYVLYVGRLVPEKGLEYLVKAWKNLNTDKKLVIVGGSSNSDSYVNELKSVSGGDVVFTGFQEGDALAELYSNSYLYCLPSDVEGMPLSLLEAMSYGNCCVVSSIPECAEVVENQAVIFEKGNIEDLAKQLQYLLDNPACVEKYKKTAARFILNKYNWDSVVNQTLNVYRGIVNESISNQ